MREASIAGSKASCQQSKFRAIDGARDCTALGVPENKNCLGARELRRKFQTADNIVMHKVAGDPDNLSDPLIEDEFWRNSAVNATNNGSKRGLPA
jgi:hypothetical protein